MLTLEPIVPSPSVPGAARWCHICACFFEHTSTTSSIAITISCSTPIVATEPLGSLFMTMCARIDTQVWPNHCIPVGVSSSMSTRLVPYFLYRPTDISRDDNYMPPLLPSRHSRSSAWQPLTKHGSAQGPTVRVFLRAASTSINWGVKFWHLAPNLGQMRSVRK